MRAILAAPLVAALAVASVLGAQPGSRALSALATKAGLDVPVAASCSGEFRPGRRGAFAVAARSAAGAGRYLVLEPDGTIEELAPFTGGVDLSCYSPAGARKLDAGIRQSETIHGTVTPRWNTTVVCAFVDDTAATCWQYSPADKKFVIVGQWVT